MPEHYIGRFAPSPTGPLHFGSLVCALGSYFDAIAHGGHWLVRMEDLDPPREMPGAAQRILNSLNAHGLHGHGAIVWQSQRHHLYHAALEQLQARDLVYRCHCTREQIRRAGGHQRENCVPRSDGSPFALRFHCAGASETFTDLWHGEQTQRIAEDPILKRKDGLYAYQLAVVVDDIQQGVTCIVRGSDLLDCTGVQRQLFAALGASAPAFGHLPLVMNEAGQKLSKQNHATALDDSAPSLNLFRALHFLGFRPHPDLVEETPGQILSWASARWQRRQVDRRNRLLEQPPSR
ncbi:tRNA glutamyl-Q(34) synthetase GluQRS [Microbulbifer hydrolyticus]|uniref:Glutamyl-Q tRNA(Asp) synthetase n=1 Tax=Microbulbifer hydrolyticus TaxID=48074 RepID=A0A6P1TD30_9GAMM|nr:tRNA glutamyl-Q(34) synthetase GluQRS [Microbulbifer hydrolyticus]MBB5212243.1 glutamyl-Q tRNA(Asp) synthetase [Microbulbifer hydrolyticus]QHQ39897.1 tRNA glutamyl-Q(34) synthetase GluQRS [Microbulbifer hydrolyticus]